jgi:hypothetical protein
MGMLQSQKGCLVPKAVLHINTLFLKEITAHSLMLVATAKPFFVFAEMLYVHFVPVGNHLAIAFLFQD